jgi:hypothetical protein
MDEEMQGSNLDKFLMLTNKKMISPGSRQINNSFFIKQKQIPGV